MLSHHAQRQYLRALLEILAIFLLLFTLFYYNSFSNQQAFNTYYLEGTPYSGITYRTEDTQWHVPTSVRLDARLFDAILQTTIEGEIPLEDWELQLIMFSPAPDYKFSEASDVFPDQAYHLGMQELSILFPQIYGVADKEIFNQLDVTTLRIKDNIAEYNGQLYEIEKGVDLTAYILRKADSSITATWVEENTYHEELP